MMKRLSLATFLLVRRKILRLYRLTPLSLLSGNYMILCVANLSRDAKFCVSTGEDAPFIGMMKYLPLPRFLLGRRKILRLYWGGCAIY